MNDQQEHEEDSASLIIRGPQIKPRDSFNTHENNYNTGNQTIAIVGEEVEPQKSQMEHQGMKHGTISLQNNLSVP